MQLRDPCAQCGASWARSLYIPAGAGVTWAHAHFLVPICAVSCLWAWNPPMGKTFPQESSRGQALGVIWREEETRRLEGSGGCWEEFSRGQGGHWASLVAQW